MRHSLYDSWDDKQLAKYIKFCKVLLKLGRFIFWVACINFALAMTIVEARADWPLHSFVVVMVIIVNGLNKKRIAEASEDLAARSKPVGKSDQQRSIDALYGRE